jgi:hypothetical protein
MLKKALFIVSNENELKAIKEFSRVFTEKYKDFVLDALYVKDILKYEIFPSTIEGIGIDIGSTYIIEEWKELEENNFKQMKSQLEGTFSNIFVEEGETVEVCLEKLKAYDLLILLKGENIGPYLKEILRVHYKPMIILSEAESYNLDKVLLLDDGGYKANRTLFNYYNNFGESKVDVLRVNVDEKDELKERFGENYNLIDKEGDPLKIILAEAENYDMILMGTLKFAVMVEKITGKFGVRIIEKIKKPIFIG